MSTTTPYDHTWQRVRLQILERDGYTCQVRGPKCKGTATQVDHIIPLNEGGARLDHHNLRASCGPCNAGRVATRMKALIAVIASDTQSASASRDW